MIYNYVEDSCTFDEFPATLTGITCAGGLNFPDGSREVIFGIKANLSSGRGPGFIVYGEAEQVPFYNRLGDAYECEAVTADIDFEDPLSYKYIDTLQMNLYVENKLANRPFRLWVSIGGRDNLDSTVNWTGGQWVDVSGTGNIVTRVNQRVSGRFISVKFYSNQKDVRWRLAGFNLMGRRGGVY
jgi:hypothetical protein